MDKTVKRGRNLKLSEQTRDDATSGGSRETNLIIDNDGSVDGSTRKMTIWLEHEYFSIGKSSTNLVVLPLLSYPCSHRVFEEGLPLLAVRNSKLMYYD